MAYKQVVGMLGDNLASLLELAKKWLVTFAIDPKKLLHTFQNIPKDDLMGLIAGTHEIKAKSQLPVVDEEKFTLLVDLGVITIPDDYVHGKELGSLNQSDFYYFNKDITDKHFSNPSRILKPGDKLWVRAFKQVSSGSTTSVERMQLLAKQNAIHTGAQGASIVYKQKRNELPKGYWYSSLDEKDRLWKDADGFHRVPFVVADTGGDFEFDLGYFGNVWDSDDVVLCFCDVPPSA